MVNTLISIRRDCLDNLEMMDPPNPAAGHYYNVYLHHSGQDGDSLPDDWGMAQGTDEYGLPYLQIGKYVAPYFKTYWVGKYSAKLDLLFTLQTKLSTIQTDMNMNSINSQNQIT